LAAVPFAAARTMIGGGARRMIEEGLRAEGRACGADDVERLFRYFIAHYSAHIADRSRPFPGLEAALDGLAADGARFAVCTNKLEGLSVQLLSALGLEHRFAAVCGQDTFGIQKPDPEMLRQTVLRAGGDLERTVMVGDSGNDIDTARAAGVPVVAVDFGYTRIPVRDLDPDRIISAFDQLPEAVRGLVGEPGRVRARA
jgi:phosphoglycolate phosphatase